MIQKFSLNKIFTYIFKQFEIFFLGVSTVVSIILGFLISGFVISKFKPKESRLLLFNVFIACVYMSGELTFLFMGCNGDNNNDVQQQTNTGSVFLLF